MYTFSKLGSFGRLGNQMFQFSTLLSLGTANKKEIGIPESAKELIETFPQVSSHVSSALPSLAAYKEESFLYSGNIFLLRDDIDIEGYFQSEKYFLPIKNSLLEIFRFNSNVQMAVKSRISSLKSSATHICGVHIRRGDYLNHPTVHTNLSLEYYKTAMTWMMQNYSSVIFLIVSDDIEWCKQNINDESVVFSNFKTEAQDMCLLQQCDLHIIANSSFSWWPAWLSNSKQVIAPRTWFGPAGPREWYSIYCNGWGLL